MEEKRMPTVQSNENWKKENTIQLSLRLMKKTEADIIEALENSDKSRRARFLELLRLGIEYEKQQDPDYLPPIYTAPAPEPIDKETLRLAQVGREYEDMVRRGWEMVEPVKKEVPVATTLQSAMDKLQRVMEERRAKEAQQAEKTE